MKRIIGFASVAVLILTLTAALAEEKVPDGSIKLSGGSVAVGVGYSWASGTLTYKGKDYPISVSGLSVGDVGATKVEAAGSVYNLTKLADFDGNYTAVGAGMTIAGGGSGVAMRNQNGVTIQLGATAQGLKFTFGAGGVSMKIKQ